jgi:fucose 4-O-acetylase-like acetyltransferase
MSSVLTRIWARPVVAGGVAVIVGYAVLGLTSAMVQEVWLGGVSYRHSSSRVLVLAALCTPLCGFAAGLVVAAIGRQVAIASAVALMLLIALETAYLFATARVDGPLWFEAGAGCALASAVLLGAWIGKKKVRWTRTMADRGA